MKAERYRSVAGDPLSQLMCLVVTVRLLGTVRTVICVSGGTIFLDIQVYVKQHKGTKHLPVENCVPQK